MGGAPDDDWLARLAAGDAAAFARLYDAFAPALFRTACRLLGQAADAEDAVQDVFASVARARARLPAELEAVRAARPSAWSFAAALAACLLIGLNLAVTAGGLAAAPAVPPPSRAAVDARAAEISAVWPELGPSAELLARREFAGADVRSPWVPRDLRAGPSFSIPR